MKVRGDVVESLAAPLVSRAEEPTAAEYRPPHAACQSQIVLDQPPYSAGNTPQTVVYLNIERKRYENVTKSIFFGFLRAIDIAHRYVGRSVDLARAAETLRTDRTADDEQYRDEIVAKCKKHYRSLGITKSGRFDPEGKKREEGR